MAVAAPYQLAHEYRRTQVETAPPTQLVVMLYDGAIRFLSLAREKMAARDLEARHTNLLKAQRIITELMSSLDREKGGEVAANLHRLYAFMLRQLVEANLRDRPQPIEDVLGMLRELRESWAEVDRAQQRQNEHRKDRHGT
jgi:flagellar protein FliS